MKQTFVYKYLRVMAVFFCGLALTFPAFAEINLVPLDTKEGSSIPIACGMFIYEAASKNFIAYAPDSEKLYIDLGKGHQILPQATQSQTYPEKFGDKFFRAFNNQDVRADFDLSLSGYCGNPENDNENCEYVSFTGIMTLKTKDEQKKYTVTVDEGC